VNDAQRRSLGRILGIAIVAGAVVLGLFTWRETWLRPRTDDASVRANVVGIAPHVSGPIVELPIVDNQRVAAGDLLFAIDPRPYEARLARAEAELAIVDVDVDAQRDAIAAAAATLASRRAEEAYAADHLDRIEPLLREGFVTTDEVEAARTKLHTARAARESALRERERAETLLAQVGDLNARREAAVAAVAAAQLDIDYCRVTAPFDGWVTNLNIAVGKYAQQGRPVFALVDDRAWYVIANFRETYLDVIRPGMKAEVVLLGYPGRRFHGVVQGIGWAVFERDGATVEGLPAVEPTLNWVRLARRFPVRIRLEPPDPERPYRMGATAVVTLSDPPDAAR